MSFESPDVKVINDNIVVIAPEFHMWSGRRAIKPDKLAALNPTGVTLPPSALASLGSVKLVHPDELKVFDRLKDECNRLLAAKGLKLFGGYAIHIDEFDATRAALKGLQAKFEDARANLLATLDTKITDWVKTWVQTNPGYQNLLQNLPSAVNVCDRMSFDFHTFRIAPPSDESDAEASGEYRTKLQGLRGELYREAAKEAQVLMADYLLNDKGNSRDYITQKTLRPIKRVSERLRQFAFVDAAAGPLADVIDWTLKHIPAEGRVEGTSLTAVWNMARLLANPEEAARIGHLSIQKGPEAAWNLFGGPETAATVIVQTQQPVTVNAADDLDQFDIAVRTFKAQHEDEIHQASSGVPAVDTTPKVVIKPQEQHQMSLEAPQQQLVAQPTMQHRAPDLSLLF